MGKPLCELEHGLAVTAAHWSPMGHALLTTCNDNNLRVFRSDIGWAGATRCAAAASHNTKTGRYITAFQGVWAPYAESVFLCGSLEQPRGIAVYAAADGAPILRMESEQQASVTSLHCFHPTAGVLAASNSSGRVYLWR